MSTIKKLIPYFIIIVALAVISGFQLKTDDADFDKLWQKVESLSQKGQPKSAIKIVDKIYKSAKQSNNTPEVIKSLLYRVSLQSSYEEDHLLKSIEIFENELSSANVPEKQILQSLIAQLYRSYYSDNRWQINQRQTLANTDSKDIKTWDALKINTVIENYYTQSLSEQDKLKQIQLRDYSAILTDGDSTNTTLLPTLFDLLSNRVLNYLTSSNADFANFGKSQMLDNPNYFAPASEFISLEIDKNKSVRSKVLFIFQQLLSIHLKQNNIEAFVDLDLRRLQYVSNNSTQDKNSTNKYIAALSLLADKYKNTPSFVPISYKLASLYNMSANSYIKGVDDENKNNYVIADSICNEAITAFPKAIGTNKCKNLIEEINRIDFGFDIATAESPGKPLLSLVKFRNTNRLYFKIIQANPKQNSNRNGRQSYLKSELNKPSVLKWEQELPKTTDHRMHSVEIKIPKLEPGYYIIFVSSDSQFRLTEDIKFKSIWITNLSYITSSNKAGGYTDMFTINRESGKPVGGVDITIYQRHYDNNNHVYTINKVGNKKSDKYGYVKIEAINSSNYGTFLFMFEKDGNQLFSENYLNFYKQNNNPKPIVHTYLFTDRAVYRPGQIVYFKGIVVEQDGERVKLLKNHEINLEFKNASRKKINSTKFVTNSNGSFNGLFVIPTGGLSGKMTIRCKSGSASIIVEEYKLPTFEVQFDSLKGQPKLGDIISVTGKAIAYAGNNINGARVAYRVVRRASFPIPLFGYRAWYPPVNYNKEIEIANGNTITNDEGEFELKFNAIPDYNIPSKTEPVFNYSVSVEVTDITGEVRLAQTTISVGEKSVILNIDMPNLLAENQEKEISISATNLNGTGIDLNTSITVFKLTPPVRLLNKRQWQLPDFFTISENQFKQEFPHAVYKNEDDKNTWPKSEISKYDILIMGKTILDSQLFESLLSGEYMIVASGKDKNGRQIKTAKFFTVFSISGKKLPGSMISWFAVSKKQAEPGQTIKLVVGSSAKKSRLLYEIVSDKTIIDRKWITINKGQKIIDIPVKEEYRGNFGINLAMVRFNRIYSNKINITVPYSNKKLDIKLSTFRSVLTPGSKEKWSVIVSGYNGEKLSSELLAGMYDASLDVFKTNKWQMELYRHKHQLMPWESNQFNTSHSSALTSTDIKYYKPINVSLPIINWFGYQFGGYNYLMLEMMDGDLRTAEAVPEAKTIIVSDKYVDDEIQQNEEIIVQVENPESDKQVTIPLRSNFNETAFFYPNLQTDSTGSVIFNFTTPDALTEWKVLMLAYTDDLKVGTLEQKIKSQKDLMIIPNVPRFVREGDTLVFTSKVVNFTNEQINTTSNIEFFDAISMAPVSIFIDEYRSVVSTIKPKQSAVVSWRINIPDSISMMLYRITSSTDNFSDGEERMFPVLTNRMLVTSTMPMNIGANSVEDYTFTDLLDASKSSTLRNFKYTVEFTSNPAWYAIQALPYLSTQQNKSNSALFNTYFANTLSAYIINSNPSIKSVFESWRNHSTSAFISNLEKNPELKNAVLSATPWVIDAEDEAEQKRRIGILFDINRIANQKENVLTKLKDSQLPSGAWPWFKGMHEDRYTTQSIVLGLAKLHNKGVIDLNGNNQRFYMVKKAVRWLDNMIVKDFNKLVKSNGKNIKKYQPSSTQTQYLYLRALLVDVIPIPGKSEKAFNYYVGQEKKYWLKQSNYLQGMIAIFLDKFGYRNESEAIVRSLKERSLYNKEMGMYWRQQQRGWGWYQSPIETQAMMIEVMNNLDNNSMVIEKLKVWLLKQKQTQHWNTTSATAEAVFALLMYGDNILEDNSLVGITVGNKVIDVTNNSDIAAEAGTGYFSKSWSGNEVVPDMASISITNENNHIAWGAAYWQYFENMDKIKAHNSPLSVSKKLFIEKLTDDGAVLAPVEPNQVLKTGDKIIVRLIISTDRNIEYVQLKDMRATSFEPAISTSGYTYSGGLWYYKNLTDVSTEFYIRYLNKGTYVLEYPLYVTQKGDFTNGIATIQSMYAPEFAAHSNGLRVRVGE